MGYREMQAAFGVGSPKAAQQTGPAGGAIAQPLADAQNERDAEMEKLRQQQQADAYGSNPENLKRGGAVKAKGWGKARGARGAKVY